MANVEENIPPELVLDALKKLLESRSFSTAPSLAKLLRFCVGETMAGRKQTQGAIAKALGYRRFDALQDSNVRREMGRLRNKLRDYYDQEGAADPLIITVPKASAKNGYCAVFSFRNQVAEESQNPRYFQLLSEARHLWGQRMPEPMMEAMHLYEEAIREDPEHAAAARAGLAECYCFLALGGLPTRDTIPKAKEWAKKAIADDPGSASAHAVLAFATSAYDWNWSLGDQLFQKAVELAPQSVEVRCWYASHLICVGRFAEAIKQARKAQTLEHDPTVVVLSHVAKILYVAGDLDHAFDLLQLTLQMNRQFYFSRWHLGLVLLDRGDADVGLEHLQQAATLAPENSGVLASLGYTLGVLGRAHESRQYLRYLDEMSRNRYVPATDFAILYTGLGETDSAFAAIERAFMEKCLYLSWIHAWPPFQRLRGNARFAEVIQRLGLGGGDIRQVVEQRR